MFLSGLLPMTYTLPPIAGPVSCLLFPFLIRSDYGFPMSTQHAQPSHIFILWRPIDFGVEISNVSNQATSRRLLFIKNLPRSSIADGNCLGRGMVTLRWQFFLPRMDCCKQTFPQIAKRFEGKFVYVIYYLTWLCKSHNILSSVV